MNHTKHLFQENALENIVCEIATLLFMSQFVTWKIVQSSQIVCFIHCVYMFYLFTLSYPDVLTAMLCFIKWFAVLCFSSVHLHSALCNYNSFERVIICDHTAILYMIFHHPQRKIENMIPDLRLNSETIERVTDSNFLGLSSDECLSWKAHVQKVSNKMSRNIGIMHRLKHYLPLSVLRTISKTLVLPHFQYSILTWGFHDVDVPRIVKT